MKKIICTMLALGLLTASFVGCKQSDGVTDPSAELLKFHESEMKSVYASFEEINAEIALWEEFSDPDELVQSINGTVLPSLADALRELDEIGETTEDIKELKSLYKTAMEKYKLGYSSLLAAFSTVDEEAVYAAYETLEEGALKLREYNTRLDELIQKYKNTEGETT